MTWAISRHYNSNDFPQPMSLDDKITLFADRVRGWQLYLAEEIVDRIPHAGFIALYSLMHYFEMIAKFMDGFVSEGSSDKYFKEGFKDASKYLVKDVVLLTDPIVDMIYKQIRCALYHTGLVGPNIILTGDIGEPIQINNAGIIVNPHKLARALQQHFDSYLRKLNDPSQTSLRNKFETRFNYLG